MTDQENRSILAKSWMAKAEDVSLRLYSINGQLQSESVNMQQGAGYYMVNMQRGMSAAGSYLVVFRAGSIIRKERYS